MARRVDPELVALRALARAKHKAATKKVSRLNTEMRIDMSGSKYDVRRDLGKVARYNSRQLNAYIKQLVQFNSRATQFVPDAHYRPVPRAKWEAYKRVESEMNKRKTSAFDRYKDLRLPGRVVGGRRQPGMTIEQFERMSRPPVPLMADVASNSPARPTNRGSRSVQSEKALARLIAKARKDFTAKDLRSRARQHRETINKMLSSVGHYDLMRQINRLTSEQIMVLVEYSGKFMHALSSLYYHAMARLKASEELEDRYMDELEKSAYDEVQTLIEWSKQI